MPNNRNKNKNNRRGKKSNNKNNKQQQQQQQNQSTISDKNKQLVKSDIKSNENIEGESLKNVPEIINCHPTGATGDCDVSGSNTLSRNGNLIKEVLEKQNAQVSKDGSDCVSRDAAEPETLNYATASSDLIAERVETCAAENSLDIESESDLRETINSTVKNTSNTSNVLNMGAKESKTAELTGFHSYSELDNEPKSIQREDAEKLRTKNKDTEEQRQKKVDKQRSTVKAGGEIVVQQKDINKEGRKVDAVEPQDSNKEKIMEERCADPAKQQATHIENMIANTQEVSRENVQGIGKVIVHRIILEDAEDEKLNKTKKNKNEVSTYSKLAKDVVVNNSQQPAKAELHNKHTEHTRDLSELPQEKVKIILHNITIEEPAITKNKCDNIIKENRLIKTTAADHEKGPIITEVEEDTVDKSQKSEVRNVLITEYKIDDEIPQDKVKIIVHNITVEEPTITEVEESSADAITSTVVSTELPVHQEFERFEELIDPECDISLPREIASIDKAEYDALVELLNDITAPLKEQQSTSSNQSQKSTLQVDTSPSQTVTAPPTSPISFLVAQEQENELMSPTSPIVTENNEPVYHTITDHEKQRSKVKQKRAALDIHFLPQLINPRFLDSIIEENSDISSDGRSDCSEQEKNLNSNKSGGPQSPKYKQRADVSFPKSNLDFSKKHKHGTIPKSPTQIPTAIFEETIPKIVVIESGYIGEKSKDAGTVLAHEHVPEVENVEYVIVESASSSSVSDLADNDSEDTLRQLDLEADAQLIISKPESETSTIIESSRETTPVNQTASSSETLVEETTRRPVVAAFELINKNDDIAKSANLLIKSENKLPQRDETQSQIQQLSDRNVLLPTSHSSSGYSTISKNNNNNTNFNLQNAAKNSTTTATTATIDNLTRAAAAAGSDRSDSIENSSSAGTSEFIRNISGSMEKHDNKNEIAASARNERERTTQGTGDETGNLKLDPSEDTPPPIPPLPANFDTYINEDVPRTQFEWQKSSNYPKEVSSTQFTRHESSKYLKDVSAKEAYFSNAAKLKATQPILQDSSSAPKEVSATAYKQQEPSHLPREAPATKFTHLGSFSNSREATATQLLPQEPLNARKEAPAMQFTRPESSKVPREMPATQLIHQESSSNSREPPATQFLSQESSGSSICSDLSQCTAINVTDTISSPDTERDISGAFSPTTVCDKKHQAAIKKLRLLCTDRIASMPFGEEVLEELAYIAQNIGELQATKLNDTNNSPTALSTQHIQQLQHRIGETKQRQAVATESGARTGNDKELCHEEEFREQQILKTAAIMRKLRKSLTPPPVAVTIPQQPAPPVPPKNPLTAAKAQGSNNTNNNINNIHKTKAFSDQQQQQQQNDASNNNKKSTEQIAHFLLNGEENKQQQQQLSPQHSLLAIIHNDANKQADNNNAPITSSSFENNSRQTTTIAGHPNMQRQILKEQEEAAATTTTSTASTPPVERVVPVAIEKSKNYQTHDQIIDDHTFSKSESKQSQSQSYLQSVSDTMKAQNRCSFPQSHMDTVDSPSGFYTFPKSLHENLGQSTAQKRLSNLETSSIDSYYGNRPQLKQQQQQQHQQQTSIKRDSYQSSKCIKNGQVVYDVSNSSHMQETDVNGNGECSGGPSGSALMGNANNRQFPCKDQNVDKLKWPFNEEEEAAEKARMASTVLPPREITSVTNINTCNKQQQQQQKQTSTTETTSSEPHLEQRRRRSLLDEYEKHKHSQEAASDQHTQQQHGMTTNRHEDFCEEFRQHAKRFSNNSTTTRATPTAPPYPSTSTSTTTMPSTAFNEDHQKLLKEFDELSKRLHDELEFNKKRSTSLFDLDRIPGMPSQMSGLNFKHEFEDLKRKRHEHMKELEQEIERSFKSRQLKRFVSLPTADQFDMSNGMQQPHVVNVPMEIENGNAGYGSAQPPKHAPAVHTVPMSVGPRQAEHHRPMPIKTDHHTQTPHVVNVPMKVETDANNTQTNFERRYSSDYTTSNLISSPSQIQSPNSVDLNYSYDQPPQYDPAEFRKRSESMFNLSTNNYNHHQPHAGYKQFEPYQSKQTRQPNQPYHEPVRRDPAEIYSQYASDLSSSENVFKPIAREVEICYQRCRPNTIRAPRLTASTNDLSASNQHYYDTHNAYNVRRTHAPMLQKTPQQHAKSHYSSCYSVLERDPNPTYISTTSRRGVSPAPQPAANATSSQYEDYVTLRNSDRDRRASLPREIHEQQLKYITSKEEELRIEFERLQSERQRLLDELSHAPVNPEPISPRSVRHSYNRNNSHTLPTLSEDEVFRQQMAEEWMNKVAEREERRMQKIIKISKINENQSSGGPQPPMRTDISEEFLNRVKERRQKLAMPHDSDWESGAESQPQPKANVDEDDFSKLAKNIKIFEGKSQTELQQLPKHLQEFAKLSNHQSEKIDGGQYELHEEEERRKEATDNSVSSAVKKTTVMKTHKVTFPGKEGATPAANGSLGGIHSSRPLSASNPALSHKRRKPHFNSKPLNKATPSRTPTKKLRFKPYVSMDNAWYSNQKESNSLLRKIHSDLNLAKSYLSADGIWTPKSQTPSSSTNDLSENQSDRNLPPTPPPPPAQPIWTPQPSPATGRKEFRPVRFESPTLPRRYTAQQSTSSLNVQPPWAEGNSNNTPANECHNTSAPNALNRKPNSGVSDKIKSLEQRSASTSDLDRPFTRRCQNGIQPFYKPNDVSGRNLHSSSGYLSEPEPNYNYDSDYSTIKYRTDGRRQYSTTSASTNNNHSYGTMPNPVKPEQSAYKNQPGRIENYVTGRSSISEREKRENLEQTKLSPHYTEGNLSRTLAKESGYTSDSNLVFRKKETPLNSPLSPVEQKLAYKTVQAGGEPPLFGFRKAAPEKPKGTLKSVPKVKNTTILEKQLLRDNETDTIFKENTRKKANMFKPFTKQMPSFIAVEKSVEKTQHSPPTPPHRKSSYTKATLKMKTKGTTLSPSKRHEQCFKAPDETPLGASKYGTVTLRSAERRGNIFRSKSAGTVPTSLHSSLSTTRPSDKENFSIACLRHHAHFRGFNPLRTQPRISSHSTSSHSPVAFGRSISKERTFAEEKKRLENTLPTVDKTIFEASTNILRDPTLRSPQDVKHAVRSYATCAAHIRSKSAPHTGTREITRSPVRAMVNTTTRHRMCFPKSYQMNFVDKEKAKKPPPLKRAVPITISTTSLTRTDSTFSVDSEAPKSVPIASKVKGKPKLETAKKRKPDGHDKTDAATSPSGHTASLGQQYLSKHSFRDASPQKSENVIVTEVAHSSRTKLPSRKSPVTVDNYLSYHKSRSLSPARANHVESCTEEIYHYSDHESEQNEVGGVDDLVWQYESRGGATINAPSSLESNTSLKEKQFSPTREIRVPQTPRHVRSPSRRRIESCRNNVRANINKVTRASSLSSADDRAKRGFYLCSDLAHSATSLTHSEMHSPTCRYQKRFADLNHFYSTLERVGQLERTTSDSNFKPIRKHSDLLDYDEWQKVRQDERAEKELAYLVNKLKQEQREKDFLFRSKDVDDIKWRREADLSLHSREKSVEDLRGDFEHKLLTREKQKFKTENDGDRKPYWRRNTIGNLTASLERNTERKDQTDIKLSKQLVSTLSKEQITRITQQLCEIYGNVNDSKPIEAEEKYVITVNRTNKPIKPNNALKVRCNSSITKEDLLGPVIAKKGQTSRDEKKKSTATTTTPVKDYQNSMSPARRTCSPVFLARETRGAVAAKNAEVSFTKPSTVDLPKTKAHVVEQKSAPSKAPKEKLKVDTTDSAPQPQATANKADNKDNILQKIQFFEERQYPEPPPTVIYHAREESSPDEQEIMRLVEKNIKFREKAALQTRHKELSTSLISLGEAFGETKSPRINYCESPQLPEPPELPPPDDQTDTFASCTMDELEELEISRTDDDYAQFQENSSLEIYDSYFRSRSLPPTQQPSPQESSHLQRVRTGEVQKIREKFESNQNTATNEQNHFFGVGTLRKVRSDPELKKGSKDALKTTSTTTTTQPSDVSRIAYKFDTCERATKKSGKRSRSRNKKTQPKTQPDITTDSAQLQSTKITAKARVEKESSKKSQPNYITEGLVQRIRSRYEHNSPPPVKHWSSSHPDIRDINAFTSQLCFFEERYSRPMKRPNDLKLQQRPSSTSPYRPPRSLPHISISTYYEYPDIFANQKFDPKIHQPKARYVPNDKAEVCSGHSGKNKTGHALCAGYCSGLKKPSAVTFQESPNRYYESDVNIHFKTPVRHEFKDGIPEEELAQRQAEQMRKLYQEERRRKYLQELQDMNSRRHTDNFTPSQKSPIPLNRYDDFQSDLAPKTPPAKIYPKAIARALYNFQGQSAKELSVKKGDIIYLRRQIDRNWYEGEHNACIGLLPVNYVEIINRSTVQQPQRKSTEGQARAKYNFQAQSGIELSINKGELITLTRRVDANWFEGKIANRKGIFPVSYVEVLTDIGAESENNNVSKTVVNDRSVTSLRPSLDTLRTNINNEFNSLTRNGHHPPNSILKESRPSRKTDLLHVDVSSEPITYRALYKYVPQNSDELELLEGDIIHLLEKCDDGWFVGTSQRTGCFGTFPGNYVERA